MIPNKLHKGDEIRVIAPSSSMSILYKEQVAFAKERLESLGFTVSFGRNVYEIDEFSSSSIKSRIEDLHDAFADSNVKAILTTLGGFNCNQLLKYIDYDLIKRNPKILCGYSDITVLSNAIFAKTGLVSYSGPHFSTFAMKKGFDYTLQYFQKCLMEEGPFRIEPSETWSDDRWYIDQENRTFHPNEGYLVINEGTAEGTIIGGNLCTLNLLQGTEFMPSLKNAILFLEDDNLVTPEIFDRDLQSILHQPDFNEVKALVIGRFQKASGMTNEKIIKIIKSKQELRNIPVIANVNLGHVSPIFTFPIGGTCTLQAFPNKIQLTIKEH
jgi:muramoyltetrapeptide carboxypeptidase